MAKDTQKNIKPIAMVPLFLNLFSCADCVLVDRWILSHIKQQFDIHDGNSIYCAYLLTICDMRAVRCIVQRRAISSVYFSFTSFSNISKL